MTQLPQATPVQPPPPQPIDPIRIDTARGQGESPRRNRGTDMTLTNWLLFGVLICGMTLVMFGVVWEMRYQKLMGGIEDATKNVDRLFQE